MPDEGSKPTPRRLQAVLAEAGIASRRAAERLIEDGLVEVNGVPARLGQVVDPRRDVIWVRGVPIPPRSERTYVALNKPEGVVTSTRSTHGERTVMDLLTLSGRVVPVGRLDKDTSGLLLLSDDGEWANLVTHPRYQIEKEYDVIVRGDPTPGRLGMLRSGIGLPGGERTAPARVERRGVLEGNARLSVTVIEGKKRQIRLMMAAVGHPVIRLRRVRVGPILLDDLPEGKWRRLRREEVESIRAHARRAAGSGPPAQAADRDRRPGRRGKDDGR